MSAMRIGYFLSCEELGPADLVEHAARAARAVSHGVSIAADEARARAAVHRLRPDEALPGEPARVLPTSAHFEKACELVTPGTLITPVGSDIETHVASLRAYAGAGVDELYVQQIGPENDAFFATWAPKGLPQVS